MNFSAFSNDELQTSLRRLLDLGEPAKSNDELQELIQELQVHRIELEMQNRALAEAQLELQHSVQRYIALYDRLPIGYITVTPHGRIIEANLRATAWLRSKRSTVVGAYLRSFLDSEDALKLSAHLQQCVESATEQTLEITLRFDDRTSMLVQLSSQRCVAADGGSQIYVAMTDISTLKQTQRRLEEVNGELDAFNHSISHDLRAPLLAISTFGDVVLNEHSGQLDEEGRTLVQRMRSAALRMQETLHQLLEYSRLTRQPMSLEPVNLDEAIRDVLIEHRGLIHYRKAQIAVEHPLSTVQGSPLIVNQVLRNLLTNALKYTLPDQPPRVRISASIHQSRVVLRISDEGIGIDPKYHQQVFRVFERLHTHSNYPGAGIGLAIVRRAMERMGGRVWLDSAPGKGSTFFVELPKA